MIPGNANPLLLASAVEEAAAGPTRSLRFSSGDSAFLNRTPSSAGNRKKFTYSLWAKRCVTGSRHNLFSTVNASTQERIQFGNNDKIDFIYSQGTASVSTEAVFRDLAWYHIVFAVDTDQSTAADRVKLYVNGVEQTLSGTFPSSGKTFDYNNTKQHRIGSFDPGTGGTHFADCYFADIHLIDGSQLDPTSFGAYDDNGVWQAAEYSGTFGTNGFHLAFGDNSTNSALGTDSSGNGNDFTTNNLIADTGKVFTSAKIYSTFSGERAANYKVEYSDNNSTWTEAFSGVMSNNASFGIQTGTGAGDGSYGFHKYWRYVVGSVVTSHHPRVSRIILSDGEDDITIQTYTTDNNSDQGGIPAEDDTFTYTDTTAASNIDSLFDVPTNGSQSDGGNGGEVSGNYAVFNVLEDAASGGNAALSNGNLQIDGSSSEQFRAATIPVTSGKWYFEIVQSAGTDFGPGVWAYPLSTPSSAFHQNENYRYNSNGGVYDESAKITDYSSFAVGDVIGTALDMDNGKVYFSKNGTWQNSGDPAAGTNPAATGLTGQWVFGASTNGNSTTLSANFGQRAFAYTAPSGYKALCTTNLPTPTIADGSDYFDVKLYTGNGSTQSITGFEFSPDWVWIKPRSPNAQNHFLYDSVRGAGRSLRSSTTGSEQGPNTGTDGDLRSFDANGFSLGSGAGGTGSGAVNNNNEAIVAWSWDAGSSTVSNTDGSITSSVRASATSGFSIVSWTGTATAGTIGHGLSAAPEFIITKRRNSTGNWFSQHASLGSTHRIQLNQTSAATSGTSLWNSTSPTDSVFSIGADNEVNASGGTFIAYCISPVAGFSAVGSYEGNGNFSGDGPFVNLSFAPAFLIIKNADTSSDWLVFDNKRPGYNLNTGALYANQNYVEGSVLRVLDLLSNGFKIKPTSSTTGSRNDINNSGDTYLYFAFATNPFQANGGLAR